MGYRINPVFLYVPNLIDYARIVSVVASFVTCWAYPFATVALYATSQLLDCIDGAASRALDQESNLGMLLDMLTDRMSSCVLFVVLSHLYPHAWALFAFLIVLDTVSHWVQTIHTLKSGQTTHKTSRNRLVGYYYTNRGFMFLTCVGNEAHFIALYLLSFGSALGSASMEWVVMSVAVACVPLAVLKQFLNVAQLLTCLGEIAAEDHNCKAMARFKRSV